MKKFRINSILFVFAAVFIITGIWGECFAQIKHAVKVMYKDLKKGNVQSILDFKATVDDVSSEQLSYHDLMMDIDSVKNNLLGTRVVRKEHEIVVKADSGCLMGTAIKFRASDIEDVVDRIRMLKEVAEENNVPFLYCGVPRKEVIEKGPENITNYSLDNYEMFISGLEKSDVPVLDFKKLIQEKNDAGQNPYYSTDHHWKASVGFLAAAEICEELSSRYGFTYNKEYTDISNYNVTVYPDWFLGSKGKKVGTYFTWSGADDFELITPKFKTSMTEEQPIKNQLREGTFEETALYKKFLEKDYYNISSYSTYSGGDFRLQILKNKLNPKGKKILLIRDSYACAVAPFLSLQTSELHICDMRNYLGYVGDKLNMEYYIKEMKPDYVVVLYAGVHTIKSSSGKYDFF